MNSGHRAKIVKVVEVNDDRSSLSEEMMNVINNLHDVGLSCVGLERITDYHWLMLFAIDAESADG